MYFFVMFAVSVNIENLNLRI